MAHSSKALIQRELLDTIKELRATIEDLRKALADSQEREKLWRKVLTEKVLNLVLNEDLDGAKHEIRNGINSIGAEPSDSSR